MDTLISVISPVYNSVRFIEKSIESVLCQTCKKFEYIIIDGGSTDGTIEVLKKYQDSITFWSSERDFGIYDAMNKGIKRSKGNWFFFLGADDYLIDCKVFENLEEHLISPYVMVYGNVITSFGRINSYFGFNTLLHNTVCHQSAFYSKSLFRDWQYDTNTKIISDYELNLLVYLKNLNVKRVDITISYYSDSGISSTSLKESYMETNYIRKKHLHGIFYFILTTLYKIKSKLISIFK
jgi:putative colanic acid biosynthesis glycosyltransferase